MQPFSRKPRVFLSHSKRDIEFIRRIEADLRHCQCEVWIDELEIRHGRPWLSEIFTTGIPSCEVVLCYITQNSAKSQMVQREIDARVVEQLANDRVALLLYAENSEVRSQLRGDLQTLQIPILNPENYTSILPRIVAEIWRSYTDAAVTQAIQTERVKRLELEIQLRDINDQHRADIFTPQERVEFESIWGIICRTFKIDISIVGRKSGAEQQAPVLAKRTCIADFGVLFQRAVTNKTIQPSRHSFIRELGEDLKRQLSITDSMSDVVCELPFDYESEFLKYGFLQRAPLPPRQDTHRLFALMADRFELIFTPKFDRFCFWLELNGAVLRPVGSPLLVESAA